MSPYQSLALVSLSAMLASAAQAQVTLDGTLGPAGPLSGPHYAITADLGRQVGGNLFHSFGLFSIQTGESATFSGPNSVNNIIGRVTGGQVSFIDGTLRSTIPGASLYLLNPAGVLFGENATLDVPGSFHVSTADYLKLSDGGRFDARMPANSVLTVAPVEAFGFLGEAPGNIELQGSFLQVPDGQTLSLIGADITLTNATVYAPAGRINVAAVGSAGEVLPTEKGLTLQGFGGLGALTVERDPTVARVTMDIGESFTGVPLGDLDTSGAGGGAIFIRSGQWVSQGGWVLADTYGAQAGQGIDVVIPGEVRLDQGARVVADVPGSETGGSIVLFVDTLTVLNGAAVSTTTFGVGNAGNVRITARNLLIDSQDARLPTGIGSIVAPGSTGKGGAVNLTIADTLALQKDGQIGARTFGAGDAGDVTVTARNLLVDGQDARFPTGIGSIAEPGSTGKGGTVNLTIADILTVQNGGAISAVTFGEGDAGDVTITAGNLLIDHQDARFPTGIFSSAERNSTGDGGTVNLTITDTLTVRNAGEIRASTFGAGDAGDVTVTARNLLIDGQGAQFFTGIASNAVAGSTGDGGTVSLIIADTLIVQNGGEVGANTFGTGDAGDVMITAGNLLIDGQDAQFFTGIGSNVVPGSTGQGGAVNLIIGDTLTVRNGGQISVSAGGEGAGNAGDIIVTTPNLTLAEGGGIAAQSENTTGGNLFINADHLRLFNGGAISASVAGDAFSDGGNVTLNSANIVILNGSTITAQANQGQGGNITVNADVFLHDAASTADVLNASSRVEGNDGTIELNAPITDLSGSLVMLNTAYLDAAGQLSPRCGTSDPEERSRFIVQGHGALPSSPDEALPVNTPRCQTPPTPPIAAPTRSSSPVASFGFGDR